MNDNLQSKIQRHLFLLDLSFSITQKILHLSRGENIDHIEFESQNRERIIKTIEKVQTEIEYDIDQLEVSSISKESLEILKCWSQDLGHILKKISFLDQKITKNLSKKKDETTQEIATIYRARKTHEGYNLNNLKK